MSDHVNVRSQDYAAASTRLSWMGFGVKEPHSATNRLPAGPAVLIMLVASAALWAIIILAGIRAFHFL